VLLYRNEVPGGLRAGWCERTLAPAVGQVGHPGRVLEHRITVLGDEADQAGAVRLGGTG
jgi:hypothetical protein